MPVLVDTNVITDVLYQDPVWAVWANEHLSKYDGESLINPIIYTELCYHAGSSGEIDQLIENFGFHYEELPRPALLLAAQAYRIYRQRGGVKTAPLSDFFIGAHAEVLGIPLLTRDQGRYQTYFPKVPLICP
jgi:predicted nucleic acid-binding protein